MATQLGKSTKVYPDGVRATHIFLSSEWDTFSPWSYENEAVKYFGRAVRESVSDNVTLRTNIFYIGPFAIISARTYGGVSE